MSFDDLVKLQCDRHETLKRVLQNFRKDAQSRKTSIYFQKRLQQIDSISKEFAETHKIIICAEGYSESSYYTNNVTSEFEERYMDVYCAIAEAFEQTHPKTTGVSTTPIDASALAAKGQVQMPQIPVPSFSGQCIDWPGFYDAFTRLIHDNAQLNEIQKFHFLKESLPESRDNDIRQMQLTAANYNVAWTTLVTRYNNPRTVFSHHMNALYNISTMHKEKGDEIRLMLSTVNVCIAAFKRVNVPVQQCDHWLAHYLASKLPKETYNAWEHHRGCKTEVPSFADFEQFLNDRLVTIDAIENRNIFSNKVTSIHPGTSKRLNVHNVHAQTGPPSARCCHCGGSHILRQCPAFLAMDCHQRKEVVTIARLCLNCLSKAHILMRCTSTKGCQQCGQRHHTLLHYPSQPQTRPIQNATLQNTSSLAIEPALNLNSNCVRQQTKHDNSNLQCLSATYSNASQRSILLATARVIIFNPDNGLQATLNALIDQGSEATIVSEHVVQSLHLKRHSTRTSIAGVGQGNTNRCKHIVNFVLLTSSNPEFRIDVETAYVLNSLTSFLPSHNISVTRWKHIEGLSLADPQYYRPKRVDLIIGVDLMAQIILPGIKVGAPNEPIAQNTQLGWILSGRTQPPREATHVVCHQAVLDTESLLKQFCEAESVPERRLNTAEDVWCETFFQQTHKRQPTGRYMVRLPLKTIFDPSMTLGKSHQIALNHYLQLERRLTKTPEAWQRYSDGIK
ncbi:uncharacterized protein LOC118756265 [Rhagoletis pomonella]|uniref:uncharacterized protein LOC118756265 n=1 Tax=Rhagoletis pomonella TaxID=28610 RepID=UPI001784620E|nr:uncharacterized protein LOC118756265 [Rhagoletis pomonella]